ncbi:hypothetical protein ACFZDG_32325 [Kitasatospora xanthocidica]|uniref:hypothetical protein n=1 Tax=Kitasatospora xanthocidica TaxID=83382 RepID=UPI0036E8D728
MPFETDLARALDRTTDPLDPDLNALLAGAVDRGRSRRRRRTAGLVAGAGVGACAVLTAAGLVLSGTLPGFGSAGSDLEPAAQSAPRSVITGARMIQTLEATFPGARFSQETGQDNNPSDPSSGAVANGGLIVDDGQGAATVGISAVRLRLPLRDGDGLSCDQERMRGGDTCRISELPSSAEIPGGALVTTEQIASHQPAQADTPRRWTVTVTLKSTGAQLQLVQWNAALGTGPGPVKPTRAAPPLTEQQAVAVLTGPIWAPILAAVG